MKHLFLLLTSLFPFILNAQDIPLNSYDDKGKKHGYWKVFLNNQLNEVDSVEYQFIGYEHYIHGQPVFKFYKESRHEKSSFILDKDSISTTSKILSGIISIFNKNGFITDKLSFYNGHPMLFESYTYLDDSTNKIYQTIDFTQKYQNEEGTFLVTEFLQFNSYSEKCWFRNGKHGWNSYCEKDSLNYSKYPYIKHYTPPYIGLVAGYEFLEKPQIELGLFLNISESYGSTTGMYFGSYLSYKRSLEEKINTVNFGLGFYSFFSMNLDLNFNFGMGENFLGFKPGIGTTLFNIQLMYGYNLFNNRKNEILHFNHHSISARFLIPVKKIKYYTDE